MLCHTVPFPAYTSQPGHEKQNSPSVDSDGRGIAMRTAMRRPHRMSVSVVALAALGVVPAIAADLPTKAPPAPVYAPPPFTWTGFYVGGNIGGAWRNDNFSDTLSGLNFSNGNNNGVFIGGGQLGFNWQVSNFVLGFEWDIDGAANNNNAGIVFIPAVGTIQVTSNNRWITTLAARFGGSLSTHITPPHTGGCAGQATVKAICPTSADGLQPPELLLCCSAK